MASASRRPLGTTAPIEKGRRSQRFRKRAVPARESRPWRDSNEGMIKRLTETALVSTGKSAGPYCAGCIAGPLTRDAGAASNTVRECRICSSAFTIETKTAAA